MIKKIFTFLGYLLTWAGLSVFIDDMFISPGKEASFLSLLLSAFTLIVFYFLFKISKEMKKLNIKEELEPVGKADGDIDNDGDKDSSDKYQLELYKTLKWYVNELIKTILKLIKIILNAKLIEMMLSSVLLKKILGSKLVKSSQDKLRGYINYLKRLLEWMIIPLIIIIVLHLIFGEGFWMLLMLLGFIMIVIGVFDSEEIEHDAKAKRGTLLRVAFLWSFIVFAFGTTLYDWNMLYCLASFFSSSMTPSSPGCSVTLLLNDPSKMF